MNLPKKHLYALIFSIEKISQIHFDRQVIERIDAYFENIIYFDENKWHDHDSIFKLPKPAYTDENYNMKLHIKICEEVQKIFFTCFLTTKHRYLLYYYEKNYFVNIMSILENFYENLHKNYDPFIVKKYTLYDFWATFVDILTDDEFDIRMFCPVTDFVDIFYNRMDRIKKEFTQTQEMMYNERVKKFKYKKVVFNSIHINCSLCESKMT